MFSFSMDAAKISRSTTRDEWRQIHRWLRVTQRAVALAVRRRLADLGDFGTV